MRLLRGLVPLAIGAGIALGVAPSPSATADGNGRCSPGTGVTVVVDYGDLGGVDLGCDLRGAGVPARTVVPRAGFPLTYVTNEAFVCRVNGLPSSSQESCNDTPPADAYWALFWSDGTSSAWRYSSSGVASLSVPEGGSIGWRFQSGGARTYPGQPPTRTPDQPSPSPTKSPQPSDPPRPKPSTAPHPSGPSPTPAGQAPPSSSAPPAGGAATPAPPAAGGPAVAAPGPSGSAGAGGAGRSKGSGKGAASGKPGNRAGTPEGRHRARSHVEGGDRIEASADTTGTARSDNGQKVLTAVATSSVVLLGAAVGVAGWRRRS